jgi:hypothetical protein
MSPSTSTHAQRQWWLIGFALMVSLCGWIDRVLASDDSIASRRATVAGSASAAASNVSADAWRMQYHNNRWWYWNPDNSWSVYDNHRWVPYTNESTNSNRRYSKSGDSGAVRHESGYRGVVSQPVQPQAATPYIQPSYRARSSEPSGGMNGQPNDPFIRGN